MKKLLNIISVIFTIAVLGAIICSAIGLFIYLIVALSSSFVLFIKSIITIIIFIIVITLIGYLLGRGLILIDKWNVKRIKKKKGRLRIDVRK